MFWRAFRKHGPVASLIIPLTFPPFAANGFVQQAISSLSEGNIRGRGEGGDDRAMEENTRFDFHAVIREWEPNVTC